MGRMVYGPWAVKSQANSLPRCPPQKHQQDRKSSAEDEESGEHGPLLAKSHSPRGGGRREFVGALVESPEGFGISGPIPDHCLLATLSLFEDLGNVLDLALGLVSLLANLLLLAFDGIELEGECGLLIAGFGLGCGLGGFLPANPGSSSKGENAMALRDHTALSG